MLEFFVRLALSEHFGSSKIETVALRDRRDSSV